MVVPELDLIDGEYYWIVDPDDRQLLIGKYENGVWWVPGIAEPVDVRDDEVVARVEEPDAINA